MIRLPLIVLLLAFAGPLRAQQGENPLPDAYLQNPAPDGMTVMWQTAKPCYGWVEYGTDTLHLQRARTVVDGLVMADNTDHKIRIGGLLPGTRYYYRTCWQETLVYKPYKKEFGPEQRSPFQRFTTPGGPGDGFTCVIFNDLHNNLSLFDALAEKIKGTDYDFVVFNGDCFTDLNTKDDAVKVLAHYNRALNAGQKPMLFTRGNHETRGAYALHLSELFDRTPYFAFTWGGTRFVMLDCGEDKPDDSPVYGGLNDFAGFREQETRWLKAEVASKAFKAAKTHVLIHHIPIYGNTDKYNPCLAMWNPILQKAPFRIAINAHIHEFAWYPKGAAPGGNPFPSMVGGGNAEKSATVMVLTGKAGKLSLRVITLAGEDKNYEL